MPWPPTAVSATATLHRRYWPVLHSVISKPYCASPLRCTRRTGMRMPRSLSTPHSSTATDQARCTDR